MARFAISCLASAMVFSPKSSTVSTEDASEEISEELSSENDSDVVPSEEDSDVASSEEATDSSKEDAASLESSEEASEEASSIDEEDETGAFAHEINPKESRSRNGVLFFIGLFEMEGGFLHPLAVDGLPVVVHRDDLVIGLFPFGPSARPFGEVAMIFRLIVSDHHEGFA